MGAPRVRFAPSPTGHLHVGGARTALFNYLFARHEGGSFLLRIEDTDRERSSEAMTRGILDAMTWLGLEVDEPPVHQADGLERHRAAVEGLLAAGRAYRCFCPPAEIEARREAAREERTAFRYDGRCRGLATEEAERRAGAGEPFAVRFAVPPGRTEWEDSVHGPTGVENAELDDFVILRSDGTPVYNLAVVADDAEMGITHVIRGDDHLSNTPKQILLYEALCRAVPTFAHVPMILGPDGKRLSKRHGATSVEAYRERGILPEAMRNFLALLGWSPGGDREVMDLDEIVAAFGLDRILKKSAVFDADKLEWLNGQHITRASPDRLAPLVAAVLEGAGGPAAACRADPERFERVVGFVKERARTVDGVAAQVAPFFAERPERDPAAVAKHWKDPAAVADRLSALRERLGAVEAWEEAPLEEALRALADELEIGAGKLIHPLRVALMGVAVSPGIFEVLVHMGRERSLRRLDEAVADLRAAPAA
ncbi:MAG: glutamate--tRNA ligase [Gemmatimonadota bacterium]